MKQLCWIWMKSESWIWMIEFDLIWFDLIGAGQNDELLLAGGSPQMNCNETVWNLTFLWLTDNSHWMLHYHRGEAKAEEECLKFFSKKVHFRKKRKEIQKLLSLRWSGLITDNINIYRLKKSTIQGDQMPPLGGLVWILDGMTLHKSIWASRMAFVTDTLFKWPVCLSYVFMSCEACFFVLICPILRQKEVNVWQINYITRHKNELSSSHSSSWRGKDECPSTKTVD